jgi:serine/threonine protein kinase
VLYEMLSGKKAFSGSTNASVIAAIMEREPEPLQTTPPLDRVIRTCLGKDPDDRFQTARDAKKALLWAMESAITTPSQSRSGKAGWVAAVAIPTLLLAALAFIHFREKPPETPVVRSTILPPEKNNFFFDYPISGAPALSPDGRRLVFAARAEGGVSRLWVRPLDSTTAQPLADTENGAFSFWSPDGRSIGFGAEGKLKKSPSREALRLPWPTRRTSAAEAGVRRAQLPPLRERKSR